jgi:hypothetical protein
VAGAPPPGPDGLDHRDHGLRLSVFEAKPLTDYPPVIMTGLVAVALGSYVVALASHSPNETDQGHRYHTPPALNRWSPWARSRHKRPVAPGAAVPP